MTDNIDLSGKSTGELLTMFNEKAALLGLPQVKRFSDRKAAERRVNEIIAKIGSVPAAANEEVPEKDYPTDDGSAVEVGVTNETITQLETEINQQENDDMATKAKTKGKTKGTGKARGKTKRENGALVGTGSYREKLLKKLEGNKNKFVPIGQLLTAVYGNNYKEYRAPLMMVMKGLKGVLADNKTGTEIRKMRENKENHFGLFNKSHPKSA